MESPHYMRYLPLLVVLLYFLPVKGQEFIRVPIEDNAYRLYDTYEADINQDGYLDLIGRYAGNFNEGISGLMLMLQQPDGSFRQQIIFEIEGGINDTDLVNLFIKDMDNDGDLDILFCLENLEEIRFLKNTNNIFKESQIKLSSGLLPSTISGLVVLDQDSDGDEDILIRGEQELLYWLVNKGNLTFDGIQTNISTYSGGSSYISYSPDNPDLTGDGITDIFQVTVGDEIYSYSLNSDWTITRKAIQLSMVNLLLDLKFGDINNDGMQDIVVLQQSAPDGLGAFHKAVLGLINLGSGEFSEPISLIENIQVFKEHTIGDLNQDGILDIVLVNKLSSVPLSNELLIYQGLGNLKFANVQKIKKPASFGDPRIVHWDEDTKPDILISVENATVFVQQENYSFTEQSITNPELKIVDFWFENRDDDIQLETFVANGLNFPRFKYLDFHDLSHFTEQQLPYSCNFTDQLFPADFNEDGVSDYIIPLFKSGPLRDLLLIKYTGIDDITVEVDTIGTTGKPNKLEIRDFDNDGDLDFVSQGSSLILFRNSGNDEFIKEELTNNITVNDMSVADFDDDGDDDIVISFIGSDNTLLLNAGNGTFDMINFIEPTFTNSVANDLDNDDDVDLIFSVNSQLVVAENLGNLNFELHEVGELSSNERGIKITIGDYNLDGQKDIIFHDLEIRLFNGIGDMVFDDYCVILDYGQIRHSKSKSIDVDGDSDLDIARVEGADLVIYYNTTNNSKITVVPFIDENKDAQFDDNEKIINEIDFYVYGSKLKSADTAGIHYYVDPGEYNVIHKFSNNQNWISEFPDTTNIKIDSIGQVKTIYVPFYADSLYQSLKFGLSYFPLRCGTMVPFFINIKNNGTENISGRLSLLFDENIETNVIIPYPNELNGDTIFWNIQNLSPFGKETYISQATMPLPGGEFDLNENLTFQLSFQSEEVQRSTDYIDKIRCSYDPNDKLSQPNRDSNLTLFEEDLEYTIRFQNTGNDFAYDVVIYDTLSTNFDFGTFEILGSSHSNVLNSRIDSSGIVVFEFRNIMLIDSLSDPIKSQGYVSFSIKVKQNLEENTHVRNRVGIYFDLNPPILTNQTENIFVSEILYDNDGDGFFSNVDCDDENPNINPNATDIPNNGIDEDCNGEDLTVSTKYLNDFKVSIFPNPTSNILNIFMDSNSEFEIQISSISGVIFLNEINKKIINVNSFPEGLYILTVRDRKTGSQISEKIIITNN